MPLPEQLDGAYNARAGIPDYPQLFARWRAKSRAVRHDLTLPGRHHPSPASQPWAIANDALFNAALSLFGSLS